MPLFLSCTEVGRFMGRAMAFHCEQFAEVLAQPRSDRNSGLETWLEAVDVFFQE